MKFPDCAKDCAVVVMLGVGECEYCCPEKFDSDGEPVDFDYYAWEEDDKVQEPKYEN